MKIVWNTGVAVYNPINAHKLPGIDEMEGWDGGISSGSTSVDTISEEEMGDDTVELGGGGWKDETADPVNAFTYQGELIELDKQFAALPMENADVFVSARLWDDEQDAPTSETIRIAPGEELTPYRMRLGLTGELQFLVWLQQDEHATVPIMLTRNDLEDVMPETYLVMEMNYTDAKDQIVYVLERENKEAIGSRQRVIRSLNDALKARTEIDLIEQTKRAEAERAKSYEEDDSAGMF